MPGTLFPRELCITLVRFVVPLMFKVSVPPHRRLALVLLFGLAIEVVFETGLAAPSFRYVVDERHPAPSRVAVLVSVFVLLGSRGRRLHRGLHSLRLFLGPI